MNRPCNTRPPGTFGHRVTALRMARGWTQYDLSAEIGLRGLNHQISLWETGARIPTVPRLFALADALGVDVNELWLGGRP